MAKDIEKKTDAKKPQKKQERKLKLVTYLKEMWGEVKKLTWLTPKELVKNTAVVIVVVLAFTLMIYILDFAFGKPIQLLLDAAPAAQGQVIDTDSYNF